MTETHWEHQHQISGWLNEPVQSHNYIAKNCYMGNLDVIYDFLALSALKTFL